MGLVGAFCVGRARWRVGDDDGQPGGPGGVAGAGAVLAAEVDGRQAGQGT